METAVLDAQVFALAETVNGDVKLAPDVGAATTMLEPELPDCTVMFSNTSA